jgi:hypothetical protein
VLPVNDQPNIWHVEAHPEGVGADHGTLGGRYPADKLPKKYFSIVGRSHLRVIERDMKT